LIVRNNTSHLTTYAFGFKLIETIEKRQGLKVACIEEVAFRMGYIDANQVRKLAEPLCKNGYGQYLLQILNDKM
jgi:glucose-1-phosphate thymidylyltransferase